MTKLFKQSVRRGFASLLPLISFHSSQKWTPPRHRCTLLEVSKVRDWSSKRSNSENKTITQRGASKCIDALRTAYQRTNEIGVVCEWVGFVRAVRIADLIKHFTIFITILLLFYEISRKDTYYFI